MILFRCAKHSILPNKARTSRERARSSYGQNSIPQSHNLSTEEKRMVDEAYLKAEERLITAVKPSLW